jgi:hypothetical protein
MADRGSVPQPSTGQGRPPGLGSLDLCFEETAAVRQSAFAFSTNALVEFGDTKKFFGFMQRRFDRRQNCRPAATAGQ